jgi:hypothetical protein
MRLAPILIQEGRKEDLRKKYSKKFEDYLENLDFILNIADLADTNFKYGDFVLKNTYPSASPEEVEHIVELVKDFDRFKESLEVKDINQYDLVGLEGVIDNHKATSKSQLKKIDTSGAKKVFEDKNLLIVKPLSFEASCKYGAGTRWCTTMAGQPSYFKSHTAEQQALYYIILKNFTRDNKFYKIAIHLTPNTETWYDSTDERMSSREKEVFSLGAPKVIETIRNDYKQHRNDLGVLFFEKLFDFNNYKFVDVSGPFKTKHVIDLEFQKPDLVSNKPNNAIIELNISVDGENIDAYIVRINYEVKDRVLYNITYSPDYFEPEFNFGLGKVSTKFTTPSDLIIKPTELIIKTVFDELCYNIEKQVVYKMLTNNEFMSSIHGTGAVWRPNKMSYGYTFKQNKGLVKKLVDYLDSDKTGTKADFLTDIGVLEKAELNGKPFYRRVGEKNWSPASKWRGQLSGFFNSAKLAGITDYDKKGQQFYLKKGPNFEKFKSGELKPI